jgi:CTP synthase (UTP-ammonia lyase)
MAEHRWTFCREERMLFGMVRSFHPPRIVLVGDRSSAVEAHGRIPALLAALASGDSEPVEPYWLPSAAITSPRDVAGFDGIWITPGSPYASMDGVLAAVTAARTGGIPLLGTCGGFQHLLLEYARNVCGLERVDHAEVHPDAADLLLVPLACRLYGEEAGVDIAEGTRAAQIMGPGPSTERYFCRFGLNPFYERAVMDAGLVISGRDESGDARVVELPDHPFFLGSLFQPELSSDPTWVHPLITAFVGAVRRRALAVATA